MKQIVIIFSILLSLSFARGQNYSFNLTGDAAENGGTWYDISLANGSNQTGGAWFPMQFDLDSSFIVDLTVNFGGLGAEGMAFVIQDSSPNPVGSGGDLLGIPTTGSSFITEFDLVQNGSQTDAITPHVSLFRDGSLMHAGGNSIYDASPSPLLNSGETLQFVWDAPSQQFSVNRLGCTNQILNYSIDIKNTIFGGSSMVYVGLTASTSVTDDSISFLLNYNSVGSTQNTSICLGDSVLLTSYYGLSSTWDSPEYLSNSTGLEVFGVPTTPTYYHAATNGPCGTYDDTVWVTLHDTVNVITNITKIEGENLADISLNLSGGLAPYDVYWTLPDLTNNTDQDLFNTPFGSYVLEVTDQNLCTTSKTLSINANTIGGQDYFSPNGDGVDESIEITVIEGAKIINSNGQVIRSFISYGEFWDGTNDQGELQPSGVYLIIGEESLQTITLLR